MLCETAYDAFALCTNIQGDSAGLGVDTSETAHSATRVIQASLAQVMIAVRLQTLASILAMRRQHQGAQPPLRLPF